MGSTRIKVSLPPAFVAQLQAKPRGTGGFQSLVIDISRGLEGSVLEVDADLRERIEHYAYDFGSGGWQQILRQLLDHIEAAKGSG